MAARRSKAAARTRPAARFFRDAAALRRWFDRHHARAAELLVGFRRIDSGLPSITWPESVDEALCVGWIDGIRRRIDAHSYQIRFTPRRAASVWSAVNIRRAQALIDLGRMRPAGAAVFAARRENRSGIYSYEQRAVELPEPYRGLLRRHGAACAWFAASAPSYRRAAVWWVVSAKQEATRQRRLRQLIADSAAGRRIAAMRVGGKG